jgi:CheY-like chemotaxis protein
LRSLKSDPATSEIPVIVVSADATDRRIAELRRTGARDYITKPLVIKHFLAAIDATLAER